MSNISARNSKRIRIAIVLMSIVAFASSLTQDAIVFDDFDGQKTHSSIAVIFMGSLAILGGGFIEWLTWLANPLYLVAIILFLMNNRIALIPSIVATMTGLSILSWSEILAAENGRTASINSLEIGYWLWILSMLILTIGITYKTLKEKSTKAQQRLSKHAL